MFCFLMVSPLFGPVIKTTFKSSVSINNVLVVVARVPDVTPASNICEVAPRPLIGSFSIDDGNCSENVSFKMNSRFFNLCRVYSNLLKMASLGEFPWS